MKSKSKLATLLSSTLAVVALSSSAHAQNLFWDGNDSAANFGTASGTWAAPTVGTATAGLSASGAGTDVVNGNSITSLITDTVQFGRDSAGTGLGGGTITVSGTVNAASLRFGTQTTGNVTLSGGTINLSATAGIFVGAGSTTVHTISSNITGAGTSLTKTGNTLSLSGANSFTGSTLIPSGILSLASLGALGGSNLGVDGTSSITIGGASAATLSSNVNSMIVYAPITTANSGITSTISYGRNATANGLLTLNGAIGGAGNLTFSTVGTHNNNLQTIAIAAAGTYSGSTTITASNSQHSMHVRAGIDNALPTSTVLNIAGGNGTGSGRQSAYNLSGFNQTLAGLTNTTVSLRSQRVINTSATLSTLTMNNTSDFSYSGNIGGATNLGVDASNVALTKDGTGTFTMTASSLYFGSTKVLGGILSLGIVDAMRQSPLDTTGSILGDGTNGLRTTVPTLTMGGLTGNKNLPTVFTTTTGGYSGLTALTLNPVAGATHTYAADIGDGATGMNLIKTGEGTQILTVPQSHTGTTTASGGILSLPTTAILPYNVAGKLIFNGGTIGIPIGGSGWTTAEVDTLLSNAVKTSGNLGIDTTNGNLVQWTPFTTSNFGGIGLNKLGPNDLTLNQPNTYTGSTIVTQGTLTITNAGALQNSPLIFSGGSVILSGVTVLNLGGLVGTGDLATVVSNYSNVTAINLNTPATPPGASLIYSGIISDGVAPTTLTKNGPGVQALAGANTYTGATQVNDGILVFRSVGSKAAGNVTAAAAGSIGLGVKASDVAFYSAADVGSMFNSNTLAGFNLDPSSGVAIDTTNAGTTFDQNVALTASRSLLKLGTGTLLLSQANSYNGTTRIFEGTVTIANATALGTTAANTIVSSGARLAMSTASLSVAEPLTISGTGTTTTNGAIGFGGSVTGMALTGPITLAGAARIQADGDTGSTLSGGLSIGANVLTINTDSGATQTINTNPVAGTGGSLVKSGGGTLVLDVANTYNGATTVNGGTLSITNNASLGTTDGATTVNGGNGTTGVILSLASATTDLTIAEPINLAASASGRAQLSNNSAQSHTVAGPINVTSDTELAQIVSNGTGSITVSGDITGTMTSGSSFFLRGSSGNTNNRVTGSVNLVGNLSKTDAGIWTVGALGETYSWTNTVVASGTLRMGLANALPSATVLLLGNATGASTGTFDLNGFNQTMGGITYQGEGVSTGTRTITSATSAVLTVNNATDFVTTGTNVSTNNVVLTGALSLTKQGAGTLELNGVNTFSGNTTVSGGILSITKADTAADANTGNDASTVTIAATPGAILDLAYSGTDEVDKLFIGGVQKAAGVWGAIGSGAANTDAKITGTGTLTVATGPSANNYASWANDPLKGNIPGELPGGDFDNDGISNIVEYALGMNPRVSTQPAGVLSGNVITYTKGADAIANGDVSWAIETSETLAPGSWTAAVTQAPGNPALTIAYTFTPSTPVRNFARLRVVQVP